MKDISEQMQALDEFVTRARSQNELHHASHITCLQNLSSTVQTSYSNICERVTATSSRLHDFEADMSTQSSSFRATLPPLDDDLRQPLAELRSNITGVPLKEYVSTGVTPQKTQ